LPECTQNICKNVRTDFQEADPPPLLHLVWKRAAMFYALPRAKGQGPRVKAPAAQAARPCRNGLSRMLASNRDAGRGRICCTAPLNALLGARLVTK